MALQSLLLLALVLMGSNLIESAPVSSSSTSSSPFCTSNLGIFQAYNIGPNSYLAQNSRSVYKFDQAEQRLSDKHYTLKQLFGQNKFQWVDTVISLNDLCLKTGSLCSSESWNEVEQLHLVIGKRRLSNGDKTYGFAMYNLDPVRLEFVPIEQPSENLLARLNDLGITFNFVEYEGALMLGDFWPNLPGNLYYQSAVFVPSRGELLINVYDTNAPHVQHIVRRKLSGLVDSKSDPGSEWNKTSTIVSNLGFKGMFRIGDRVFGMDGDNVMYELSWTGADDSIEFDRMGHLKEFFNCYNNSTVIGAMARPRTTTTTAAPTTTTTTTTPTTTISSTLAASGPSQVPTKSANNLEVEETHSHSEVEIIPAIPSNSLDPHNSRDPESSAEIREEDSVAGEKKKIKPMYEEIEDTDSENPSLNDIRHRQHHFQAPAQKGQKDLNKGDDEEDLLHQNDAPNGNSLAEASARGPFTPPDDGLFWTFGILVGVLLLLSLIILIPILIIRHKSRTDRMYLNKVAKTSLNTSNCSEEVQLMNASNVN